jgi:hypothetical protein
MLCRRTQKDCGVKPFEYFVNKVSIGRFSDSYIVWPKKQGIINLVISSVTPTAFRLRAGKLKFWLPELLGQLDALHTQNFEIQVTKGSYLREVFKGFTV